jgi:gluconokinase
MTTIDSPSGNAVAIVLTGVSGSGKSEVGRAVAKGLGLKFLDADDFHSNANKDKMHRGIALTDDDRLGWLKSLHEVLRQELDSGSSSFWTSETFFQGECDRPRQMWHQTRSTKVAVF